MTRTGYVWDRSYLGHFTSTIHPERAQRVEGLDHRTMGVDIPGLKKVEIDKNLALVGVRRVHDPSYVQEVQDAHRMGRRTLDNGETRVSPDTWDVALNSAAGAMTLVAAVCKGEIKNGFAAIRPPGHHAGSGKARGFCIFNNVAAAARLAQAAFGMERVMILDWDVHPADGTMAIFYDDPSVHVVSVHQDGIFTDRVGTREQTGRGEGEGTTWNVPLPEYSGPTEYFRELEPVLERAAAICKPDLILISAGFDAHIADPLGGMKLDDDAFRRLTRMVGKLADQYAEGRVVSILEGGYNPRALGRSVRAHVEELTVL